MTRTVTTQRPSFPEVTTDVLLGLSPGVRWQVVCGDEGHWRVGVYSPPETGPGDVRELETHDCPEFFLLLQGRMVLVLEDGAGRRELELEPMQPALVRAAHCGYCPDGPHTGVALVVERDAFVTAYRPFAP